MSEQDTVYTEENTGFKTIGEYLENLKTFGEASVAASEVVTTIEAIMSRPKAAGQRRGQLAGLDIQGMSLDQLKREKINAGSVLYKAKQRGAAPDTIEKNQARFDAVVALLNELQPPAAPAAPAVETGEVNEEVAAEV